VQQTAGSLRDLQAFSQLQAYTAPRQLSRQPLLPQTVGRQFKSLTAESRVFMADREPINIRIQYKPSDFVAASRAYRKSIGLFKLNKFFAILFFVLSVWILFLRGLQWYSILLFLIGIEAWFDVIGDIQSWFIFLSRQRDATKQLYEVRIDELGVTFKRPLPENSLSWAGYKGILESESAFMLIIDKGILTIFPKRTFRDDDQRNRFRIFAQEKNSRTQMNIGGRVPPNKACSRRLGVCVI
jgi:hypothetical protein